MNAIQLEYLNRLTMLAAELMMADPDEDNLTAANAQRLQRIRQWVRRSFVSDNAVTTE